MNDPLPCPFCGSENVKTVAPVSSVSPKFVVYCLCLDCKAQGPQKDNPEAAKKAWNMELERRQD